METKKVSNQSPGPMPPVFSGEVVSRLTFKEAIGECISKYATFTGRARRSEYWWFGLFTLLIIAIPLVLMVIAALASGETLPVDPDNVSVTTSAIDGILMIVLGLSALFLIIPSLSVQVRRLHDVGRSGWWLFWGIIASFAFEIGMLTLLGGDYTDSGSFEQLSQAFDIWAVAGVVLTLLYLAGIVMSIIILVFSLQDSHKGENKYGPSPKYP